MSNFLIDIIAPNLVSPNFASDLEQAFENIDTNFKKIVSAPYLEGQEGDSIMVEDKPIVDPVTRDLTEFGKAFCNELFRDSIGSSRIERLSDIDRIAPPVLGNKAYSQWFYENGEVNPDTASMKVFVKYDPDSGNSGDYICSAEYYYFQDMRVEDLGRLSYPSTQVEFRDFTCLMFAEFEGYSQQSEVWKFTKGVMLPTLYFDSDRGCFCWKINDSETGIKAQGIKGDNGRPPVSALVKGSGRLIAPDPEEPDKKILSVFVEEYLAYDVHTESGEIHYDPHWESVGFSDLLDGDLVCCVFTIEDTFYNTEMTDMIIGNIRFNADRSVATIELPNEDRMSELWKDTIMFYAMEGIRYDSTDMGVTKAFHIPAKTPKVSHAMFEDDSKVGQEDESDELVIKRVHTNRLLGSYAAETRMYNDFTGEEGTTEEGDVDVENSKMRIEYNTNVVGTSKAKVNRTPGVLLGCPVGSIVQWIDSTNIPEGWYITGETSEVLEPVFRLMHTESDDAFDLIVFGGNDEELGRFYFADSEGNPDSKFIGIFCAMTGREFESPVIIETDRTSIENYMQDVHFEWNSFDYGIDGTNASFWLTKYIDTNE